MKKQYKMYWFDQDNNKRVSIIEHTEDLPRWFHNGEALTSCSVGDVWDSIYDQVPGYHESELGATHIVPADCTI